MGLLRCMQLCLCFCRYPMKGGSCRGRLWTNPSVSDVNSDTPATVGQTINGNAEAMESIPGWQLVGLG